MNGGNNSITGKITHILPLQTGDSKKTPGQKWHKQEFVLETLTEWPRQVCFQLWGEDRINQANIQLNDIVTVQFELSSREFNGKWYTNVDGRFVTKGMAQEPNQMGGSEYGIPSQNQPFGGQPYGGHSQSSNYGGGYGDNAGLPPTGNNFGAGSGGDDLPF